MANNLPAKPLRKFLALYEPKPMQEPTVPSDFDEINVFERIGVVLSYIPKRLLWHISPDGGLQAWWKLLTRLVLTFVPLLIILVIVTSLLMKIMENIMWFCIFAAIAGLIIAFIFSIVLPLIISSIRKFLRIIK